LQTWVRTGNLELAGFCFFIRPILGGIGRQPPINTSVYGMAVNLMKSSVLRVLFTQVVALPVSISTAASMQRLRKPVAARQAPNTDGPRESLGRVPGIGFFVFGRLPLGAYFNVICLRMWSGNLLSMFTHSFDVELDRFAYETERFVSSFRGSDTSR